MIKEKLINLYHKTSKHSHYQILPPALKAFVPIEKEAISISRFEKERMDYIRDKISFQNKTVLDIGGNTGYFSFEAIDAGADQVDYYEGDSNHADFVEIAANYTDKKINVENSYFDATNYTELRKWDIILFLNVVHHLGDDFGKENINLELAKTKMTHSIQSFYSICNHLVLQMGFCWKGDSNHLLFTHGTKKEMISFIEDSVKGYFEISHIGIADKINDHTQYQDLDNKNIQRKDNLGEFRNRPLFILKAIK